ncbi:MAG: elongation factor G [Desulfobacteraceae bacterium]|jgi:elongation factor G|nr:MAG: elongation factor G [Desulfobacteraceae bacterium]
MTEMTDKIRNIALIGHGGAGKTSLAEAMLFNTGATNRFGNVTAGNTVMDFEPEELKRGSSISTAFHPVAWKKHIITLIDTPGDQNFFSDTRLCMQAADGLVVVLDAIDGVKVQSEQAWAFADEFELPRVIFVNKLDRERADFMKAFQEAADIFEPKPIVMQFPIGKEADFKGIVDLVQQKAYTYSDGKATACDIPADMKDAVAEAHEQLVENIAEADDKLIEKYLEGETLTDDELKSALRKGTLNRTFVPVFCGSAVNNIGMDLLCNYMVDILPSPGDMPPKTGVIPGTETEAQREYNADAPFSALVFKTIADPYAGRLTIFKVISGKLGGDGTFYNANRDVKERYSQLLQLAGKEQKTVSGAGPGDIVAVAKLKETKTGDTLCDPDKKIQYTAAQPMDGAVSYAIVPKSQGDEDKIFSSLTKLMEEDPAIRLERNDETRETIITGTGQIHIEITLEKLKRKYNVEATLTLPKIPYKETIKKAVRVQGRHKKQTGGHGQFGDCWVQFEPLPRGSGFEFVDKVVGGSIPRTYIPAVEKGIIDSCVRGVLAGYPCIDFRATLDDGSYHAVDSSEMAFKIAGSLAFKKAVEQASPVLLEPIMEIEVITPDEFMGDIMGDLNGRRGRVLGMDSKGKNQVVRANVPMSEVLTYAPDLRSMTGGRGIFFLKFSHYDEVPAQMAQKIIDAANAAKE